jgi:hypothetical protein
VAAAMALYEVYRQRWQNSPDWKSVFFDTPNSQKEKV